jgi:predicted  nucleic acid-binding Zn-ribbon protein
MKLAASESAIALQEAKKTAAVEMKDLKGNIDALSAELQLKDKAVETLNARLQTMATSGESTVDAQIKTAHADLDAALLEKESAVRALQNAKRTYDDTSESRTLELAEMTKASTEAKNDLAAARAEIAAIQGAATAEKQAREAKIQEARHQNEDLARELRESQELLAVATSVS